MDEFIRCPIDTKANAKYTRNIWRSIYVLCAKMNLKEGGLEKPPAVLSNVLMRCAGAFQARAKAKGGELLLTAGFVKRKFMFTRDVLIEESIVPWVVGIMTPLGENTLGERRAGSGRGVLLTSGSIGIL